MPSLLSFLGACLLGYAGLCLLAYLFQDRLLYFPRGDVFLTPAAIGVPFEEVFVTTEDNVRVHGWYMPYDGARRTLLFCHGNGGNIAYLMETIRLFRTAGCNLLVFDYRGYGRSEGSPDEMGTYHDVRAIWRFLIEKKGFSPKDIVLVGRSLGGAVAAWLATVEHPAGLVIESSFTSVPDIATDAYPFLPVRLLSRSQYATVDLLGSIKCPVLIIHSKDDEIVPYHHGQKLFERALEPKRFLELTGTHNEGFFLNQEVYANGIRSFINQLGTPVSTR